MCANKTICWYGGYYFAKKLIFKEFVHWEFSLNGISAFDHLIMEILFQWNFCFCLIYFELFMFTVINYAIAV